MRAGDQAAIRNGSKRLYPKFHSCGSSAPHTPQTNHPSRPVAFSYRAAVQTTKGEWVEVKVPLDGFVATSFGRQLRDAGPVEAKDVHAIGFLLGDGKAGPFVLEVGSIEVVPAAKRENGPAGRSSLAAYQTLPGLHSLRPNRPRTARRGTTTWTLHPGTLRGRYPADSGKGKVLAGRNPLLLLRFAGPLLLRLAERTFDA